MVPGGWEIHEVLSEENKALFASVNSKLNNAVYTPLAVGTMSVGSQTVCFICKAVSPNGKEFFAKVTIQIPIGGEPKLQSAKEIFI